MKVIVSLLILLALSVALNIMALRAPKHLMISDMYSDSLIFCDYLTTNAGHITLHDCGKSHEDINLWPWVPDVMVEVP